MNLRTLGLGAVLALALGVAGCETATPYQPLASGASGSGGFSDQKLDANHFRVTFQGNSLTSRQTVETYLLYRAAEITVSQGYDWFETVDRHTERQGQTYIDSLNGPGYAYGYWRPYWRSWGGFGWGGWGPYWGDAVVTTIQKYQASAVVVMGHGPKPAGDVRAIDARDVMTNLGPHIVRPTP